MERLELSIPSVFLVFSAGFQEQPSPGGLSWWAWLLILAVIIVVVWWLITRQTNNSPSIDHHVEVHLTPAERLPDQDTGTTNPTAVTFTPASEALSPGVESKPVTQAQVESLTTPPIAPVEDDLEIIEGIGPKIAAILKAAGILSFAQLAAETPGHLQSILHSAGLRLGDPTTWPAQARLAADCDWEGLKTYQERLTAGRDKTGNHDGDDQVT